MASQLRRQASRRRLSYIASTRSAVLHLAGKQKSSSTDSDEAASPQKDGKDSATTSTDASEEKEEDGKEAEEKMEE